MFARVIVFLVFVAPRTHATITGIYNCASRPDGVVWKHNAIAVACANTLADSTCALLFPTVNNAPFPTAGGTEARPLGCYSSSSVAYSGAIVDDAVSLCPKTCGLCCLTRAHSCSGVQYPRVNCDTVTASWCRNPLWNSILAEDCPAACGFCINGGCFDEVVGCAADPSICNIVEFQAFVNTNCRKTCGKCTTPTTPSPKQGSSCGAVKPDSSPSCKTWAANGFCTNDFYTLSQRRSYCATTCVLC